MDTAIEERAKAILYKIHLKKYLKENKINKFSQLSKKQLSEYFHEQTVFVEEELGKFKGTLEIIAKNCGKDISDKICQIFTMSIEGIKQSGELLRHKDYCINLCEKYRLDYIAKKLREL